MFGRKLFLAAAFALVAFTASSAQAGVSIGVNFGVPIYRPCYRHHHYYRPAVVVAPAPIVVAPRPVVVAPAPVVVAPAPACAAPAAVPAYYAPARRVVPVYAPPGY